MLLSSAYISRAVAIFFRLFSHMDSSLNPSCTGVQSEWQLALLLYKKGNLLSILCHAEEHIRDNVPHLPSLFLYEHSGLRI